MLNEARVPSGNRRCPASPMRRLASSGYASGVKHPLDARVHLIFFDKFPPVSLRNAFPHCSAKTGVLFKQAHDRILYQPLGIGTGMAGDLDSCASCSGVKWTSMPASVGMCVYAVNGRCRLRVSGDNRGFRQGALKTLLSGGAAFFWRRGGRPPVALSPLGETGKGEQNLINYFSAKRGRFSEGDPHFLGKRKASIALSLQMYWAR